MDLFDKFILAAPLLAVLWTMYKDKHKMTREEADSRKRELEVAVNLVRDNAAAQNMELQAQLRDERKACREDISRIEQEHKEKLSGVVADYKSVLGKMETRLEKYEDRLHKSTTENGQLAQQIAKLEGKNVILEKVMPKLHMDLDFMTGGRRRSDPPAEGTNHHHAEG